VGARTGVKARGQNFVAVVLCGYAQVGLGIAQFILPAVHTLAAERCNFVDARSAVLAWVGGAFIGVDGTVEASVAGRAHARVGINFSIRRGDRGISRLHACGTMLARNARTLVDVGIAVVPSVARIARTSIGVNKVGASTVLAWGGAALVDVDGTGGAAVAGCACTVEGINRDGRRSCRVRACGAVMARTRATLVDVGIAVAAAPTVKAFTHVRVDAVVAGTIRAWGGAALVVVNVTGEANPTSHALASKRVYGVRACGAMKARVRGTLVKINVTIKVNPPSDTSALVEGDVVRANTVVLARY
jgi:hypothetical protein